MFKTYIDNYNSKEYKEYLDLIKKIFEYKENVNKKGGFFKETKDEYHVKYKKFEVKITKPKYLDIETEINRLKEEKKNYLFDYEELKYNIINELNTEKDFKTYDNLIKNLIKIDEEIENITEYSNKVNQIVQRDIDLNNNKIKEIDEQIKSIRDKINNDVLKDDIERKKVRNIYFDLLSNKENLEENYYVYVNNIILKKPKIEYIKGTKTEVVSVKPKKSKVKPTGDKEQEKRYKLKEQIKKKNAKNVKPNETMDETISRLEKGIKEKFLAEFKFKNEEECSSGSYSADYFTKKPQILKIINKYPDIKKMMSKGYQKKDKKEICKEIYKL